MCGWYHGPRATRIAHDRHSTDDVRRRLRREVARLSNDQTFAVTHPVVTRVAAWVQAQFPLRDFEGVEPRKPRRRNNRCRSVTPPQPDDLGRLYEERAEGRLSTRSMQMYRWLRNEMLACASAETGRRVGILDLFANPELLGRMLVSDRCASGRVCAKSTIAHRRTAIRSVATILRPELQTALGLAIARAILIRPRVLILDDATSSVDARMEQEIRTALRRVMEGRTTIIISHRLSTIALADEVVLIEAGRVVDVGTHNDLLRTSARYAEVLGQLVPAS